MLVWAHTMDFATTTANAHTHAVNVTIPYNGHHPGVQTAATVPTATHHTALFTGHHNAAATAAATAAAAAAAASAAAPVIPVHVHYTSPVMRLMEANTNPKSFSQPTSTSSTQSTHTHTLGIQVPSTDSGNSTSNQPKVLVYRTSTPSADSANGTQSTSSNSAYTFAPHSNNWLNSGTSTSSSTGSTNSQTGNHFYLFGNHTQNGNTASTTGTGSSSNSGSAVQGHHAGTLSTAFNNSGTSGSGTASTHAATTTSGDGIVLNLNSGATTFTATNSSPVTITVGGTMNSAGQIVGGHTLTINAGQKLTAAEYLALGQVMGNGSQTILLSGKGSADGGTASFTAASGQISSLVVPKNVVIDVVGFTSSNPFTITGSVRDYGTITALQSGTSAGSVLDLGSLTVGHKGTINDSVAASLLNGLSNSSSLTLNVANNVVNHGSISSLGVLTIASGGSITNSSISTGSSSTGGAFIGGHSVNLTSATGTFNNSGHIVANGGSIKLNAPYTQNITLNNTGGTISATQGAINIRDNTYNGSAATILKGGDLLSQQLNINAGSGAVTGNVGNVTGVVNTTAGSSHFTAATQNLILGNQDISGDPTYYNTAGNITFAGSNMGGAALALIASQNVSITGDITNNGTAAALTVVAGANFTTTGGTGNQGPDTTSTITINGGTAVGGSITDTGNISTNGGNVNLVAYGGTGAGAGTLNVKNIDTSGSTTGLTEGQLSTNGNVLVLAGANTGTAITTGTINTQATSANATTNLSTNITGAPGNVTLAVGAPQITGGSVTVVNGAITSGSFAAPAAAGALGGAISTGAITAGGASGGYVLNGTTVAAQAAPTVSLLSGGSITTGNIDVSGAGGAASPVGQGTSTTNIPTQAQAGGAGGTITLNSTGSSVNTGYLRSYGGGGAGGFANAIPGGNGGNGGTITINAGSTVAVTGDINASGGGGGASAGGSGGVYGGGVGGTGGTVTISDAKADVTITGPVLVAAGGGGNGQSAGNSDNRGGGGGFGGGGGGGDGGAGGGGIYGGGGTSNYGSGGGGGYFGGGAAAYTNGEFLGQSGGSITPTGVATSGTFGAGGEGNYGFGGAFGQGSQNSTTTPYATSVAQAGVGDRAGAAGNGGTVTITGRNVTVNGTIGTYYGGQSTANPNPFTTQNTGLTTTVANSYSGYSVSALGTGGAVTVNTSAGYLSNQQYFDNANYGSTTPYQASGILAGSYTTSGTTVAPAITVNGAAQTSPLAAGTYANGIGQINVTESGAAVTLKGGELITPAERVALVQTFFNGTQTLTLTNPGVAGQQGFASGGNFAVATANLPSSGVFNTLVLPAGVTENDSLASTTYNTSSVVNGTLNLTSANSTIITPSLTMGAGGTLAESTGTLNIQSNGTNQALALAFGAGASITAPGVISFDGTTAGSVTTSTTGAGTVQSGTVGAPGTINLNLAAGGAGSLTAASLIGTVTDPGAPGTVSGAVTVSDNSANPLLIGTFKSNAGITVANTGGAVNTNGALTAATTFTGTASTTFNNNAGITAGTGMTITTLRSTTQPRCH